MSNTVHNALQTLDEHAIGSDHRAVGIVEVKMDRDGICNCPFCNSGFKVTTADDDSDLLKCRRCGYRWMSRGGEPMKCPKCGSYAWNKPMLECRCNVCNYNWISRKVGGPSRCPNCKSNRWDEVPGMFFKELVEEDAPEVKRKWVLSRYEAGEGCIQIASALGLPVFNVIRTIKEAQNIDYLPRL